MPNSIYWSIYSCKVGNIFCAYFSLYHIAYYLTHSRHLLIREKGKGGRRGGKKGGCQEEETQIGRKENSIVMKSSESFDKYVPDLRLDHFSQHIYTKLLVIIISAFVTTTLINAMVRTYTEPFLGPLYTLPLKDPRTSWMLLQEIWMLLLFFLIHPSMLPCKGL